MSAMGLSLKSGWEMWSEKISGRKQACFKTTRAGTRTERRDYFFGKLSHVGCTNKCVRFNSCHELRSPTKQLRGTCCERRIRWLNVNLIERVSGAVNIHRNRSGAERQVHLQRRRNKFVHPPGNFNQCNFYELTKGFVIVIIQFGKKIVALHVKTMRNLRRIPSMYERNLSLDPVSILLIWFWNEARPKDEINQFVIKKKHVNGGIYSSGRRGFLHLTRV